MAIDNPTIIKINEFIKYWRLENLWYAITLYINLYIAKNDEEGNKRLYVPAVIAIKDGKIVGFDDETAWDTKGYETPDEYWENEDLAALKEKLRCMMRDCEKSICTSSCNK